MKFGKFEEVLDCPKLRTQDLPTTIMTSELIQNYFHGVTSRSITNPRNDGRKLLELIPGLSLGGRCIGMACATTRLDEADCSSRRVALYV